MPNIFQAVELQNDLMEASLEIVVFRFRSLPYRHPLAAKVRVDHCQDF